VHATIPASMNTTAQREHWNGNPAPLETVWTLSKRHRITPLVLYTHQLGWGVAGWSPAICS
jgi:hypothetical protein